MSRENRNFHLRLFVKGGALHSIKDFSTNPYSTFLKRGGLLLYKGQVAVLTSSPLRIALLHEFHVSKLGGHFGILWTYRRLTKLFYWEAMNKDVGQHVGVCDVY
jgi:hypothetical protein